jgi:hypothetical protein
MWYQWPAYLALLCVGGVGWWLSRIGRALRSEDERVTRAERETDRQERERERRTLAGAGR